ncbi:protein required for cytochrome oxidase assembly [Microbacterium barkeri]|uniref:Protein required for cytochrome oxidase assembly n=1 Tax=Microbacterium barkeri TaxID=33917 RepID=A0A9W6H4U3_9MICO|nr:COX15/CtaA family protein [Microbacterium barkeri]MDR6875729.1 cytochrome c oxidase assembly protein subunit 15 [Microbacterium barkeri]GLJ62361.1 protein required for cytochrome oxidase assembly [Microbacterium barkeri]
MPADTAPSDAADLRTRFVSWLPTAVDARVRVAAWLSFIAETVIIGTGGAVRLTGSGLGCSDWPLCTPESLVPTPEMGVHGLIEFGNRTMTGVVGLVALAVLVLVWRMRAERRDLFALAAIVLGGIVAQAVVGGITVWTGLNPFIVGFHYAASLTLVCLTAAFLVRAHDAPGPRSLAVPRWYLILTHVTSLVLAVTILFGVLTTGSGPHSGDAEVIRRGFDATVLAHVHSWPGYILLGLVVVLLAAAWTLRLPTRRWMAVLLLAIGVQILVGVIQARNGLPELLVGIHMVLAALSAATFTVVVLRMKTPAALPRD